MKKLVLFSLVLLLVTGCGEKKNIKNNDKVNTGANSFESSNEFDISIEDQYDDVLKRYFNYDSLYVNEYDNLARYPIAYKDTMIEFYAIVLQVIEESDDNFKILCELYEWVNPENKDNYIIIEGKYVNGKRYLKDDNIKVTGIYKGMNTYNISSTNMVLPTVSVDKIIIDESYMGYYPEYDEEDIRKIAESFFGTTFTLVKPNYNLYDEKNIYLMSLPFHYVVTLDNQTNARFSKYRFYTEYGRIDVATENEDGRVLRNISKSSDNKNFILTTYTPGSNYLELQMYDKDFKLLWSRQFENVDKYLWENNNNRILLTINSDTYYINEIDGKNIIDPFITGEALSIKLLSNGDVIFISEKSNSFIMYIDNTGKVLWKKGIDSSVTPEYISAILVANEKIYINYGLEGLSDLYVNVYDKDGKELVSTFTS